MRSRATPLRDLTRRASHAAALSCFLVVAVACSGDGDHRAGDQAGDSTSPPVTVPAGSTDPADRTIATAQQRLAADPDDPTARHDLAVGFLAKARSTFDPSYYVRADEILADLVAERPDDVAVLQARSAQLLVQHRFAEALTIARHGLALAPGDATLRGSEVDALNELGRYDEALAATQAMADVRPDLRSLARVSYARELHGDLEGAVAAMSQAFTAGSPDPLDRAFAEVQLGDLLLLRNDVAGAEAAYAAALGEVPDLPTALGGRARAAVARGDPAGAAALLAPVVDRIPLPELAVAYGDALAASGQTDEAARAYGLVDVEFRLQSSSGVQVDLELALYLADHHPGPDAQAQAEAAVAARPNVGAWDALAWARFTSGDVAGAVEAIPHALALGTIDPRILFHAATIEDRAGDPATAETHLRALLATNWRFSALHVADVRALAARLGVPVPPPA